MDEQQRPDHRPRELPEDVQAAPVIDPDSALGRAMAKARERWEGAAPAETTGVDEAALHKALDE